MYNFQSHLFSSNLFRPKTFKLPVSQQDMGCNASYSATLVHIYIYI